MPDGGHYDLPRDLEDSWFDFRRSLARRGRSPRTIGAYREKYEGFWRWALGAGIPPDPGAVDHQVVNLWLDAMLTMPVVRNGKVATTVDPATGEHVPKMLAPSTRVIAYRNLRPFFTWWAQEYETVNPFDRADSPGDGQDQPIPVVPLDDLRKLLAACDGKNYPERRDAAVIRVLLDTGARLGEMANLTLDDWNRQIDVLALDGKTGPRAAPISASTGEALSRYLRARKLHPMAHLPALWLGTKGRMGESGIAQLVRRRCRDAGIAHINPHRFRHTWAHEFRAEGGSEGDLMYLAGWKSSTMAHRYGSSAAAERAQKAARALSLGDRL